MEKWNFHDQFHTFHAQGYARAETGGGAGVIGSVPSFYAQEGAGAVAAEAAAALGGSVKELVEVTALCGGYNLVSRFLEALRLTPEQTERLPPMPRARAES